MSHSVRWHLAFAPAQLTFIRPGSWDGKLLLAHAQNLMTSTFYSVSMRNCSSFRIAEIDSRLFKCHGNLQRNCWAWWAIQQFNHHHWSVVQLLRQPSATSPLLYENSQMALWQHPGNKVLLGDLEVSRDLPLPHPDHSWRKLIMNSPNMIQRRLKGSPITNKPNLSVVRSTTAVFSLIFVVAGCI